MGMEYIHHSKKKRETMKIRYIWNERIASIVPDKPYEVVSIESGYYDGWYRIVTETGEESIFPPDFFEIVDSSNPVRIHDPLTKKSNKELMTPAYKELLSAVHSFICDPSKQKAIKFVNYVDDFWFNHEEDLYTVPDISAVDEYTIADDIMTLCDRFDDCDEIVEHDRYCIWTDQLYDEIKKRIDYIDNPEYE